MPIRCGTGTSNPTRIYCGTSQVIRAYCGTNLVYGSAPDPSQITFTALTVRTTPSFFTGVGGYEMVNGTTANGVIIWDGGDERRWYTVSGNTITFTRFTTDNLSFTDGVDNYRGFPSGVAVAADLGGFFQSNKFYTYTISSSTGTETQHFSLNLNPPRAGIAMSGDGRTGLLYGGATGAVGTAAYQNDFYRYSVSGNVLTVSRISASGSSITGRSSALMVGSATSGLILGGYRQGYLDSYYRYSANSSAITLTQLTRAGSNPSGNILLLVGGNTTSGVVNSSESFFYYKVVGNTITFNTLTKRGSALGSLGAAFPGGVGFVGSASSGLYFRNNNTRTPPIFRYTVS